jgi:SCY1-like protein 2
MGSSIFKDYDVKKENAASGGPGKHWKIHTAVNKVTHANCSVWSVEKKALEQTPKLDAIWTVLKQDALILQTLRFPLIVNVSKPLEDVKSALVMETEPITSSLSALIEGKRTLDELEIKLGLIQLCEALNFVHANAQLVHLNLSPNSVMICHPNWKLAGFAFSVLQNHTSGVAPYYDPTPATSFSSDRPRATNTPADPTKPSLDYMAPEFVFLNSFSPAADMFSLGCLIYELYWLALESDSSESGRVPKKLMNTSGNVDIYRRSIEELVELNMDHIPRGLRKSLESLLATDPLERPTAEVLLKTDYFNDTAVKILQYLLHVNEHDDRSKADFLKGLKVALSTMTFSTRILETRILPVLLLELRNTILVPLLLPNLFLIAEMIEKNANVGTVIPRTGTFANSIYPAIAPLVLIPEPFQTVVILLQRLEFMSKRLPESVVSKSLAPMACQALEHQNGAVVVLALKEILPLLPYFDHDTIRTSLTPRVLNWIHNPKTPQVIRVQALFCLSKLIPFASRQFIETSILPSVLRTLDTDRSPTTLTSIAGVCDVISLKFGTDFTSHHLLPCLFPLLTDPNLARKQFDTLLTILNGMVSRITDERRKRFDELDARTSTAILNNQTVSNAEKLEAFGAQLPAVTASMTQLKDSSSSSSMTSTTAASSQHRSSPSSALQSAGNTSTTPAPLGSTISGGHQPSKVSVGSSASNSLLTPTTSGSTEGLKGPENSTKGAAAFNALLTTQAQRRQAIHEQKEKNTLIDENDGYQGATMTAGAAVNLMPLSSPSVAPGSAFGSDLFSLDISAFNIDTLTPSSSQLSLGTAESTSSQDLSSFFGAMPVTYTSTSSLGPTLPIQVSNTFPISSLAPVTAFSAPPSEDDDFFNPRAMTRSSSANSTFAPTASTDFFGTHLAPTNAFLNPPTSDPWLLSPTITTPPPSHNSGFPLI